MRCIKNPKSFLGIKYYGGHKSKIASVGKFMVGVGDRFVVEMECVLCGAKEKYNFVTHSELLHSGLTNKEIEEARLREVSM